MKSPIPFILKACVIAAIVSSALSSCSVSTDGPAMAGASHGQLGSSNMCDYYYKKQAGWTYTFQCVENVYSSDESAVVATYYGPNETVYTMGFDGFAPGGDSLFRYEVSYKITSQYYVSGRQPAIDLYYLPSTHSNTTHGAWVDGGYTVPGMTALSKRPRPVSTDTILAGVAGRLREITADFEGTSGSSLVTCRDTLWTTSHSDTVFIWERRGPGMPLVTERCLWKRDFTSNPTWAYDIINPVPYTTCVMDDANSTYTPALSNSSYSHTAKIKFQTTEIEDQDFNREWKFYACGVGPVDMYSWFYTTSDGLNYTKKDFERSLVSLTHN